MLNKLQDSKLDAEHKERVVPVQSFSAEIWTKCLQLNLPQKALETQFIKGIANCTLSIDSYIQFMMQDIVYLDHGAETYKRTAKHAKQQQKIDIQKFCEDRSKSWTKYAKYYSDKYHVKPDGIIICDALKEYLDYETYIINKYGPEYALVAFYGCVKLWPFLANTLKKNENQESNNNLYQFWIDGNLKDKSAKRTEEWIDKLCKQGRLDKELSIQIVCNCIKLEINFFKQACDETLDGIELYIKFNKSTFDRQL